MTQIIVNLSDFFERVFPTQYWNTDYIEKLTENYLTAIGFVLGLFVFVLLYFTADNHRKVKNFFIIVSLVALLNALDSVNIVAVNFINNHIFHIQTSEAELMVSGAFNPISIMVMILIVSNAKFLREKVGAVLFVFDLFVVNGILLQIHFDIEHFYLLTANILRILFAAMIFHICSKVAYKFVTYSVFGVFFIVTQAVQTYIMCFYSNVSESILADVVRDFKMILSSFKAEYVMMILLVLVLAFFELSVVAETKISIRDFHFERIAASITMSIAMSIGIVMFGFFYSIEVGLFEEVKPSYVEVHSILESQGNNEDVTTSSDAGSTIDGDLKTYWKNDVEGKSVYLKYFFDKTVFIRRMDIANGNHQSEKDYKANGRLSNASASFLLANSRLKIGSEYLSLDETGNGYQKFEFMDEYMPSNDEYDDQYAQTFFGNDIECDIVSFEIGNSYQGSEDDKVCISEVRFYEYKPKLQIVNKRKK